MRFISVRMVLLCAVIGALFVSPSLAKQFCDKDDVLAVMNKVCNWQLDNLPVKGLRQDGTSFVIEPNDWIRGALFTGVMAAYDTTKNKKYLDAAIKLGNENAWKPGNRFAHADRLCIIQTYAELYFITGDANMIAPSRERLDAIIANPARGPIVGWEGNKNWSWCDALFMAPPAFARMAKATGKKEYLDFMDVMFWDTTEHLYDTEEHLFYRDARFKKDPNGTQMLTAGGKKIFWSRGDGWVIAGIARVLQYLPQDYPTRDKYVKLFKEMAHKLAAIQPQSGLWGPSLLDTEEYPVVETSGSGFFCYALAWGINNGILEKEKFLPVVEKAWNGLTKCIDESGKLGYVQRVGASPQSVTKDDSTEYGVGAFLLAASEVVKLCDDNPAACEQKPQ